MNGYTLTWRGEQAPRPRPADGAFLRPDLLGVLPLDELKKHPVPIGHDSRPLGDFFEVAGGPAPDFSSATLTLKNAPRWARLGARMAGGTLVVEGDAGDELGASMTGGLIRVTGDAGHRVAGPDLGATRGANGGTIVIHGHAGDHAGLRMRRGLVVIAGTAGASPGFRTLAGTLVVARGPLDHPLLEARRGTLLALTPVDASEACHGEHLLREGRFPVESVVALRLVLARVRGLGVAVNEQTWNGNAELWSGDTFELGKGEVWQWVK